MSWKRSYIICRRNISNPIKYSNQPIGKQLCFNTSKFSRCNADWSVENIKPNVTQYRLLIDVNVLPRKKRKEEKKKLKEKRPSPYHPVITQFSLDTSIFILCTDLIVVSLGLSRERGTWMYPHSLCGGACCSSFWFSVLSFLVLFDICPMLPVCLDCPFLIATWFLYRFIIGSVFYALGWSLNFMYKVWVPFSVQSRILLTPSEVRINNLICI